MRKSDSASPSSTRGSPRFGGIFDVEGKQHALDDLNRQASAPEFWTDQSRAQGLLREKSRLERTIKGWQHLADLSEEIETLAELADESDGPDAAEMISEALVQSTTLETAVRELEIERLLGEEGDDASAILEINSGAGGTDASDWAEMLKRMYLRWAERRGYKTRLVDEQPHPEAGIKSATIEVDGPYAYGYLRAEIGVHRLVRISPFDASARRHTAFASVAAYPDIDDSIEVDIRDGELRIDTYRASGAGGQHVNTTDSAVRITHLPTGIVVQCQNERSQHKNKASAMKMLRARIYQHELQKRQAEIDAANAEKKKIEWGSQIRSYVLHPYRMVKDTRTGVEVGNTDRVLDGDIMEFMEAWLAQKAGEAED
ncbi:MAG: peptide chain release factor 2 [Alphaproteobacteria bacterium]|nr:peptide chain release factor 2 [Alphaproteobacteria bacterium]